LIFHAARSSAFASSSCESACFSFSVTWTPEIYTLSLHDALPICRLGVGRHQLVPAERSRLADNERPLLQRLPKRERGALRIGGRSDEHTSELQPLAYLVSRPPLEKKSTTASRSILSHPVRNSDSL